MLLYQHFALIRPKMGNGGRWLPAGFHFYVSEGGKLGRDTVVLKEITKTTVGVVRLDFIFRFPKVEKSG